MSHQESRLITSCAVANYCSSAAHDRFNSLYPILLNVSSTKGRKRSCDLSTTRVRYVDITIAALYTIYSSRWQDFVTQSLILLHYKETYAYICPFMLKVETLSGIRLVTPKRIQIPLPRYSRNHERLEIVTPEPKPKRSPSVCLPLQSCEAPCCPRLRWTSPAT